MSCHQYYLESLCNILIRGVGLHFLDFLGGETA